MRLKMEYKGARNSCLPPGTDDARYATKAVISMAVNMDWSMVHSPPLPVRENSNNDTKSVWRIIKTVKVPEGLVMLFFLLFPDYIT